MKNCQFSFLMKIVNLFGEKNHNGQVLRVIAPNSLWCNMYCRFWISLHLTILQVWMFKNNVALCSKCFLNSCWMCFLWIRMTLTFIGMTLTYILLLQMTVRRRCVCQNSSKLIAIPTVYRYLLSFGWWSPQVQTYPISNHS